MKKFFIAMALVMGAVLIAGCGKSEQDYMYKFEGTFVSGTEGNVPEVRKYFTEIGLDTRENWYITAKSSQEADAEALRRFTTRVYNKVDESKFFNVEDKFLFRITLTNLEDNRVLKKVEYGEYK